MRILVPIQDGLRCPACGQQAMTWKAKQRLGSAIVRACDHCAAPLSVSSLSALMLVSPGLVGLVAMKVAQSRDTRITIGLVCLAGMLTLMLLYWKRLPLVRR